MTFLKYTLATIFGLFLFLIMTITFFLFLGAAASGPEKVAISENSMLQLNFDIQITEREEENPFEDFDFEFMATEYQMGLKEIKDCIRKAAKDDKIKGIYLNLNGMNSGFAIANEIRQELIEFKKSEKPIIAYSEYYSEGAYQIASVADKLLLHPMGNLEFNGFNMEMLFFKGLLDKLELEPIVIKVGEYKSFAEPFIRKEMSEANREQMNFLMNDFYGNFINNISEDRGISNEDLISIANEHKIRLPRHAVEYGLVDGLAEWDEAIKIMKEEIGLDENSKVSLVSYNKYKKINPEDDNNTYNKIAILLAEGEIRMGQSEDGILGASTFVRELRDLREDDRVKAIVIRVNSPGGSAVASELMEREIQLTKGVKPVIASMSDLAASGGYWISMACDKIIAQESTITGSIGVIGLLFNIQDFLNNKLGISVDKVKTGEFSDIANGTHSMTEEEREIIQESVNDIYYRFTDKVSKYRNLNVDTVLKYAEGRVWSGKRALQIGLVDEVGDMERAIELAAELGELESYRIKYYPPKEDFFQKIFDSKNKERFVSYFLPKRTELEILFDKLQSIRDSEGILARMPYGIEFNY